MVKIFSKVHCKAYMAVAHDGVHIQMFAGDGTYITEKRVETYDTKAIAYRFDPEKGQDVEIADLSEFDESYVEKTYRERIECEFDGVLVGYRLLNVKGIIGTGWESCDYGEYGYCFKRITERPKVGIVYFKNNCKRYVLPEDMEEIN